MNALEKAIDVIKELQDQNKKITNENSSYKEKLEQNESTIKEYEAELGMDNEHSLFDPHDSPQKQERKARTHRKWRCIEYLNKEHDYKL